mmetsp:Transcript_17704/g.40634  ORF Transcript_17704/g.40634 Transcript_17704/m.40634 type:complete len:200 (-) Transcript_17704:9-608(-)
MATEGMPPNPSIRRHPSCTPLSAPSTRVATTCPITMAALFTDTRTPRRAGGASSAMYCGTVDEAVPIARPTTILPVRRTANELASAIRIAPAVKMTQEMIRSIRRPSALFAGPLQMAPTAASARVEETSISCSCLSKWKWSVITSIAPETTPVSYPKRKPPSDATPTRKRRKRSPLAPHCSLGRRVTLPSRAIHAISSV